jgi:hypothetical protein
MLAVPSANWGDVEKLKWQIAVSKGLRWSPFTMEAFLFGGAGVFDVTVTAALDDVRLTGLRVGMPVTVSPHPSLAASVIVPHAWVANDDELTMRIVNVSAVPVNEPSRTWSYFGVLL